MSDRGRLLPLLGAMVLACAGVITAAGSASAAPPCATVDDFEFSCVTDGGFNYAVLAGYTGTETDLVVPTAIEVGGDNYPVLVIGEGALASIHLTSVVLPSDGGIRRQAACSQIPEVPCRL